MAASPIVPQPRSRISKTLFYNIFNRELNKDRPHKNAKLYADRSLLRDLDIVDELKAHTGCVNALSWSTSGRLLASGSDDQDIFIHAYQPHDSNSLFHKKTTIATGHSANIFSVKFMPHSGDSTIVSAAGDNQIRVFDIEHSSRSDYYTTENSNARIYRSHSDRAKRIITESSPYLFLSCSEDGQVRQWDIRQPSSFYPRQSSYTTAPPPLISYKHFGLELNSISCSASRPHYLALAGGDRYCYLHDRRMLGRDLSAERGLPSALPSASTQSHTNATRCVRRYGPPTPKTTATSDHITACKISDAHPDELIVSWSGNFIYSFDLTHSPDAGEHPLNNASDSHSHQTTRKRSWSSQHTHVPSADRSGLASDAEHELLRIRFQNGQTEYVATQEPAGIQVTSRTPQQVQALDVAAHVRDIRESLYDLLNGYASPTELLHSCDAVLDQIRSIVSLWTYPTMPSQEATQSQNTLRATRDLTARFVQACGIICQLLSPGSGVQSDNGHFFRSFQSPISMSRLPIQPQERFAYDFFKAIVLWLGSGIGALLDGFRCRQGSNPGGLYNENSPVPYDAGADAVEEFLMPYLFDLASTAPIIDVDATVFQTEATRMLYETEQLAVTAFRSAINIEFEDLSAGNNADGLPTQESDVATRHWLHKVARSLVWQAGRKLGAKQVDLAFGGTGDIGLQLQKEEDAEMRRYREVVPARNQPLASDLERFDMAPSGNSGNGGNDDDEDDDMDHDSNDDDDDDDDDDEDVDDSDEDNDDDDHNHTSDDDDDDEATDARPRTLYKSQRRRRHLERHAPCMPFTRCYKGHTNIRTVKDVDFFGQDDEYVVSGSDDGNMFIWDRKTSELLEILHGDDEVVNVVQGHPYEPTLAVSGIDSTIKVFSADARAREARSDLASRRRTDQIREILEANEQTNVSGNSEAFIARGVLAQIAAYARARQQQGAAAALPQHVTINGHEVPIDTDQCTVM